MKQPTTNGLKLELGDGSDPTLELKSVGIDIGSSTSHLTFSKLLLARDTDKQWGRFEIVERSILCRSRVIFTPYEEDGTIDGPSLNAFIAEAYKDSGITVEDIAAGAVIVTGEAARRENAEKIANLFASQAGKFVCATAGPVLEAIMAAYGSGAAELSRSRRPHEALLSVDVGGSTTKFAVVRAGQVVETAAVNVGGRLVRWDEQGRIVRWETFGKIVADSLGIKKGQGEILTSAEKERLASALAGLVLEVVRRGDLSPLAQQLLITRPLLYQGKIERLIFSGGAAEYFYGRETEEYGDLGKLLAAALGRAVDGSGNFHVLEPLECLRATVIGASQYTVQVSGSTIFASREGVLPIHNVPVLLQCLSFPMTEERLAASVQEKIFALGQDTGNSLALAFRLSMKPSYDLAKMVARAVSKIAGANGLGRLPLILVFDQDMARVTGEILLSECGPGRDIVCVDEVELRDFDYIDIGEPFIKPGTFSDHLVVPVVVKSLVFSC